jgi:hypothetical protein
MEKKKVDEKVSLKVGQREHLLVENLVVWTVMKMVD